MTEKMVKTLQLRMTEAERKTLEQLALADRRSLNQYVMVLVRKHIAAMST